jgi:UDPglucose 6-dehydrogenase
MKLGAIGLGRIGLPMVLTFCKAGFYVKGVDAREQVIERIKCGQHFVEPQVCEYLEKYGENLEVSTDYSTLRSCDAVFIITQTPSLESGEFDLQYVESALEQLHKINSECIVVVSSTINTGDMNRLRIVHERICYNPEFIAQGSIIRDFENPKFTLIGAYTREDGECVAEIWRRIHNRPIFIVDPVEAEIIKISLNVSLTLGITFANIIGELCERFGADPDLVMRVVHKDVRKYRAGLGFGGPCFPRDTTCFGATCSAAGVESGFELSKLLNHLNEATVERYTGKILKEEPRNIAFIGVAYKQGVGLTDESQSIKIIRRVLKSDPAINIFVYDRLAEGSAKKELPDTVCFCESLTEAVEKADIVFIGLPDSSLSEEMFEGRKVIDPWRCVSRSNPRIERS